MAQKKYVSLSKLSTFLDNLKDTFSALSHKHTITDITDYTVDNALSSSSTNPVQNKILDAEFDAIASAMNTLEQGINNVKSVQVTGDNGLTGGGTLEANRTIGIADGGVSTAKLADKAVTSGKLGDDVTTLFLKADGSNANSNFSMGSQSFAVNTQSFSVSDSGDISMALEGEAGHFSMTTNGEGGISMASIGNVDIAIDGSSSAIHLDDSSCGINSATVSLLGYSDINLASSTSTVSLNGDDEAIEIYADSSCNIGSYDIAVNADNELNITASSCNLNGNPVATTDQLNNKVPNTRKINDKALSSDITLTAADIQIDYSASIWAGDTVEDALIALDSLDSVNYAASAASTIAATTAGSGSAYTVTVDGITSLTVGVSFVMVPHATSTSTTPTLNVNGLGAKNIRRRLSNISSTSQTGYSASWLFKGKPFRVVYDGTYWIVDGLEKPSAADLYGTVSIVNGGTGATTADAALESLGVTTYVDNAIAAAITTTLSTSV